MAEQLIEEADGQKPESDELHKAKEAEKKDEKLLKRIKIGDRCIVNFPRKAPVAIAKIVALTSVPGKHVGVEFEFDLKSEYASSLDGKADPKRGLWVHPQHILTEKEHAALVASGDAPVVTEYLDEIMFDVSTGKVKPVK